MGKLCNVQKCEEDIRSLEVTRKEMRHEKIKKKDKN